MHSINLNFIPKESGVYLVGGTVRDAFLGRRIVDIDIAVSSRPGQVAQRIADAVGRRVVVMGKPGQEIYRIVARDATYDVTALKGQTISEDLLNRDFTINAMALSAVSGEHIDPAGGMRDLTDGVVRMVSPGAFKADPLRMLRAFRFAAGFGFEIDGATLAQIRRQAFQVTAAAGERQREEWLKILEAPHSTAWLLQMDQTGLLGALFPELRRLKDRPADRPGAGNLFSRTISTFAALEQMLAKNTPALLPGKTNRGLLAGTDSACLSKHAALLLEIDKEASYFLTRARADKDLADTEKGASVASAINRRLRFSNTQDRYVSFLVKNHQAPSFLYERYKYNYERYKYNKDAFDLTDLIRFFRHAAPFAPDLVLLAAAQHAGNQRFLSFLDGTLQVYFSNFLPEFQKPPLITGHDLIREFELEPSALFTDILDHIEEQRLAGKLATREAALKAAEKFLKSEMES